MRGSEAKSLVVLVALLGVAGCTRLEYALGQIPFLAYLREAPSFDPYEAPRPAPLGAVPFESPLGDSPPMIQATEPALTAFGAGPHGRNPFEVDSAFLALGQVMYDRHCMVCHGTAGMGDGPIVQRDPAEAKYALPVRNLTDATAAGRTDGYIYGVIRVGRGLMPAYGARTTHRERWAIVEYVRQLQTAAGQTRTGGGAGGN